MNELNPREAKLDDIIRSALVNVVIDEPGVSDDDLDDAQTTAQELLGQATWRKISLRFEEVLRTCSAKPGQMSFSGVLEGAIEDWIMRQQKFARRRRWWECVYIEVHVPGRSKDAESTTWDEM